MLVQDTRGSASRRAAAVLVVFGAVVGVVATARSQIASPAPSPGGRAALESWSAQPSAQSPSTPRARPRFFGPPVARRADAAARSAERVAEETSAVQPGGYPGRLVQHLEPFPARAPGAAGVPGAVPAVPVGPAPPGRRPTASQLVPPERPGDHPLARAIEWAKIGLKELETIDDYCATVAKRERWGTKLNDYEYFFVKIRHKPFSVYIYFLSPESLRGQEVIWVEGQNNGNMWAHTVGIKDAVVGTVSLSPTGMIAMKGQRYPLTEIGLLNMVKRLIEVGQRDMQYGECEVNFYPGAKVNDRACTCLQVVHPVPRRNFLFHIARIFVDEELLVPIRYESWGWPQQPGGPPELIEEYTYLNLKLNNGFTDLDFDIRNPNYKFR